MRCGLSSKVFDHLLNKLASLVQRRLNICFYRCFNDHFSCPGKAIGRLCVCVCVLLLNDLWTAGSS